MVKQIASYELRCKEENKKHQHSVAHDMIHNKCNLLLTECQKVSKCLCNNNDQKDEGTETQFEGNPTI